MLLRAAADLVRASVIEYAARCNDLGLLYKATGRYDDAQVQYEEALAVLRGAGRLDAIRQAGLYHNLAGIEHARRRFERGVALGREGLALRRQALGPDHPLVAEDMAALAAILEGCGQYGEADRLYRDALRIFTAKYRPGHFSVAVVLNNLGTLRYREERFEDAEDFLRQALDAKRRLFGRHHPEFATTLTNLARVWGRTGRTAEATSACNEAFRVFLRALGPGHPLTIECGRIRGRLQQVPTPGRPIDGNALAGEAPPGNALAHGAE